MLLPLLHLAGVTVQQGSAGWLTELALSSFTTIGVTPNLLAVLSVFVVITTLQALLNRWQAVYNTTLVVELTTRLSKDLYRAIAHTNWLFFSRSRASDFTHALTTDLGRISNATQDLLSLVATGGITLVYLLLAIRLSPVLTALVLVCGVLLLLVQKRSIRAARQQGEDFSSAAQEMYFAAMEHLGGMKTVKSYGAEEQNVGVYERIIERLADVNLNFARNSANMSFWFRVGSVLTLSVILYVSLEVLALPIAGLLILLFLFYRLMPQFSNLQQGYQRLVNELPAFTAYSQMLARCKAAAEPAVMNAERVELKNGIHCSQLSFGYDPDDAEVLSGLDLFIRAGETTAIVGASGVGKSTLADLVMGLVTPTKGRILVDDKPLDSKRLQSWRSRIGYVTQDTFLFHDTIRSNLLWACPGASENELLEALRMAAAEEFVAGLPLGLDTVVGDRGVRLSGGEKQRLALARALLRRPAILILDEATSALDSENERRIQRAIEHLHGNLTILIITHRLSTIREVDLIYVLDHGAATETGDWDGLLAKDGRFRELYRAQMVEASESVV